MRVAWGPKTFKERLEQRAELENQAERPFKHVRDLAEFLIISRERYEFAKILTLSKDIKIRNEEVLNEHRRRTVVIRRGVHSPSLRPV